ncbi:MAG: LacI family DNA-binding transcriptional regulator [Chloroflexi bacterium]|nr:LacI family DNA-binding transcriptional regulator [Chloroflexota bacterium]MBV9547989.1 LacI family DNA-binding transcriptional regulator [Chloroflexota bacterium]
MARRAGVSSMTVSRVVNGSSTVTPATQRRVERALRELGYIPNRAARSLVVNRLGVLALLIPDISNPFFPLLVRGAEAAARAADYAIVLGNSDEDLEREESFLTAVCSLGVDGVLLAPAGDGSGASLELLTRQRVPFVLIDRTVDGVQADIVRGESRSAACRLTEHLIDHGHERIALVSGPLEITTARYRELGFCDALAARGLSICPELMRRVPFTRSAGHRAALGVLSGPDRPTGLVTANNFLAFGALDAARDLGIRVPEELAIVTFDDVEIVAEEPFLTCAAQPAEAMGRVALERLIERLHGDELPRQEVVLDTEIRIRHSCGCA